MLNPRKPIERVLVKDPRLDGLHDSKLVCIDISPDLPDRVRSEIAWGDNLRFFMPPVIIICIGPIDVISSS